jgi:hypothetical protein
MTRQSYCPSCGAGLVSEPIGAPLGCKNCRWYLIGLAEWKQQLSPFEQGYTLYMQAAWPTSELAGEKNPYAEGTPEWREFCHGERRAVTEAQDGEE